MKVFTIVTDNILSRMLLLLLLLSASHYASSQARTQADVSITTVSLTAAKGGRATISGELGTSRDQPGAKVVSSAENLKCTITVHSYHDDDANQTMLVVIVPVEVSIVANPSNATIHRSNGTSPFVGYLTFNLGSMAVGQSITVEFTFTKSTYGNKVGAYAFSATPDPNPANNYKEATY